MTEHQGGCLCGAVRYRARGEAGFPHLCSCRMCQRWSGAPTVAWARFPKKDVSWVGDGGEPTYYRSSKNTQRGFCSMCGGTVCAVDDGSDVIDLTISTLDDPSAIVPDAQHSFKASAPRWVIAAE